MRGVRVRRDERGAAAIVVALSLVVVMAAAMLTIDAGMLWNQRRTIATATDAAALAEARRAALTPGAATACGSQWVTMLSRNTRSQADALSCTVLPGDRGASFEVRARLASPVGFGAALGVRDAEAFASSVARFDPVSLVLEKTRPIAVCTQNTHMQEWFAYLDGTIP
ncbi:MAG TPA: pilus assembly protein TadG-related protein, partial [Actinomycetota bacterium]|nr:pilus assembly protein TadG-related protein [Actinomycetota bacterium]